MKYYYYLIILFILFNFSLSCPNYPKPRIINQNDKRLIEAYKKVDEIIQKEMKNNNVTNLISTIVYMDETVWEKSYGNINPLDDNSPNLSIDSTIRIGSITKLFTSLMMYILRDNGKISSLDDEIVKYYPKFKINDIEILNGKKNKKGITFRELASHLSGLPRETPCPYSLYGSDKCTENIILERLSKQFLISNQYEQPHYSNLGFSILGRVLGEINNSTLKEQESYQQFVTNEIFKKLGMLNSTFNYEDVNKSNLALPYTFDKKGNKVIVPNQISGFNSPGGGIYTTARDMTKFLMFWLNTLNSDDLLNSSTKNEALTAVSLISNGNQSYGTPFEMFYDNSTCIWYKGKNGLVSGYKTQLTMAIPLKLGAFACSLYDFSAPDVFTREVLNILIPVYERILNEIQDNDNNNIIDSFKDFIIGNYKDQFGTSFNIYFKNHTRLLLANYSSMQFEIQDFDFNFPHIKRLKLLNISNSTCGQTVNGPNSELIYFDFNFNDENNNKITKCSGVQIMGQSLLKIN